MARNTTPAPVQHVRIVEVGKETLAVVASIVPNGRQATARVSTQQMDVFARAKTPKGTRTKAYRFTSETKTSEGGDYGLGTLTRFYVLRKV